MNEGKISAKHVLSSILLLQICIKLIGMDRES
jgi:hypothetical protein